MKYRLIFIFCLFANILLSQAKWGFRVGNSISTFKNGLFYSNLIFTRVATEPPAKIKPQVGIDISLFIKYPLTSRLSIQPEFHFLNKGGEVVHENFRATSGVLGKSTFFKLDVLEVPIIFKYHLGKRKSFIPFLGTSFGYRVGYRLYGNNYCTNYEEEGISICSKATGKKRGWKEFQKPDVSGVLGFSYEEKLLGQNAIFDIRYLFDFNNDYSNFGVEDATLRHRNLLISVGLEF